MRPQQLFNELNNNFTGIQFSGLVIDDEIQHATLAAGLDPDDHEALIMRLYFIAMDPEKNITYFINQYGEDKYLYFIKVKEGVWLFILSNNHSFAKLHFYIKFLLSDNQLSLDEPEEEVEFKNDKLDSAKRIQDLLLPNLNHTLKQFAKFELIYRPRDVIGGDFYWTRADKDVTWIVVGDCTGHSLEGALASVSVMSILNQIYQRDMKPHWMIKGLHQSLANMQNQSLTEGYGIGCELLVMRFDHKASELAYSGTGMPIYHLNKEGKLKVTHTKSANLDPTRVVKYIRTRKLLMAKNDTVLVHSDGIKDQLSPKGKRFTNRNLLKALFTGNMLNLTSLDDALKIHQGNEHQTDDIVALKVSI
jgi:hypothetical protein